MKKLTKKQKQKADKIIKMCTELYKDGVVTIMVSAPDNNLSFYRKELFISFEEYIEESNKGNIYSPTQSDIKFDQIGI